MKTIISADTQYNDLVGNIAIDKIFNKDIEEFFKDKGIDTDKYGNLPIFQPLQK